MALTSLPFCVIVSVLFPPAYSFPLKGSISHSQPLLPLLLLFLHREPLEEISWPSTLPPLQIFLSFNSAIFLPTSTHHHPQLSTVPISTCILLPSETFLKPSPCLLLCLSPFRITLCQERRSDQIQSEHPPILSCLPSSFPRYRCSCLLNFSLFFSKLCICLSSSSPEPSCVSRPGVLNFFPLAVPFF